MDKRGNDLANSNAFFYQPTTNTHDSQWPGGVQRPKDLRIVLSDDESQTNESAGHDGLAQEHGEARALSLHLKS